MSALIDYSKLSSDLCSLSKRRILAIGQSHTTCLYYAAGLDDDRDIDVVDIRRYPRIDESRNELLLTEIAERFDPKVVFTLFGGSEHNVFGLLESDEPYDFLTPVHSAINESRKFVPFNQIKDSLESRMERALNNLAAARALFNCRIYACLHPPPFFKFDDGAKFPVQYGAARNDMQIAPPDIRQKLYYTSCRIVESHAKTLGISVIEPPKESMDDYGFLLRSMWHEDPTHGKSSTFGALMLSKLKEAAE